MQAKLKSKWGRMLHNEKASISSFHVWVCASFAVPSRSIFFYSNSDVHLYKLLLIFPVITYNVKRISKNPRGHCKFSLEKLTFGIRWFKEIWKALSPVFWTSLQELNFFLNTVNFRNFDLVWGLKSLLNLRMMEKILYKIPHFEMPRFQPKFSEQRLMSLLLNLLILKQDIFSSPVS